MRRTELSEVVQRHAAEIRELRRLWLETESNYVKLLSRVAALETSQPTKADGDNKEKGESQT